jgi:hypothetical protein
MDVTSIWSVRKLGNLKRSEDYNLIITSRMYNSLLSSVRAYFDDFDS